MWLRNVENENQVDEINKSPPIKEKNKLSSETSNGDKALSRYLYCHTSACLWL